MKLKKQFKLVYTQNLFNRDNQIKVTKLIILSIQCRFHIRALRFYMQVMKNLNAFSKYS